MVVAWTWVVLVKMERGDSLTLENVFLTIMPSCLWESIKIMSVKRLRHLLSGYREGTLKRDLG